MSDVISAGRIEAVQRHIWDALTQSSDGSTLPGEEQDRLLVQACVEACDLLTGWLASPQWQGLRPSGPTPIGTAVPDWERVRPLLDPLRETLAAIAQRQQGLPAVQMIGDPDRYVSELIEAAARTARRYPRLDGQKLFEEATSRSEKLRDDVCRLASEYKAGFRQQAEDAAKLAADAAKLAEHRSRWRRRATGVLRKIPGFLLAVSLTMAGAMLGASPQTAAQNVPAWGHAAVSVVVVHHVAHAAQPEVKVAPPRMGPRVR